MCLVVSGKQAVAERSHAASSKPGLYCRLESNRLKIKRGSTGGGGGGEWGCTGC